MQLMLIDSGSPPRHRQMSCLLQITHACTSGLISPRADNSQMNKSCTSRLGLIHCMHVCAFCHTHTAQYMGTSCSSQRASTAAEKGAETMAAQRVAAGGAVVRAFASNRELSQSLGRAVAAATAAAKGDVFTVAISGGSLPALLAAGLVGDAAAPEAGVFVGRCRSVRECIGLC